jgi:LAS superfamily LD-carboxypeptidase LdcB
LPIIERVAWILKERGQLPDIKLKGGDVVNVRPISPLSKAKDLEDIQVTNQIMQLAMAVGNLKQTGAPVDVKATIENLRSTAKERHLAMMTDEQIAQEQEMAMMAQAAGAAGGA